MKQDCNYNARQAATASESPTLSNYSVLLKKLHDMCMVRLINCGALIAPADYDLKNGRYMDDSFDPATNRYWDDGFNSKFKQPIEREDIRSRVAKAILEKPNNDRSLLSVMSRSHISNINPLR